MLSRNGYISTQAASIRLRCPLLSCVRKNSSRVSFFRSLPNHTGSPDSRLLTTVRNLLFFLSEPLAEGCLGRQLLGLFHSHAAFRTSQTMHFHDHRRA
jgi:hypothetical protein